MHKYRKKNLGQPSPLPYSPLKQRKIFSYISNHDLLSKKITFDYSRSLSPCRMGFRGLDQRHKRPTLHKRQAPCRRHEPLRRTWQPGCHQGREYPRAHLVPAIRKHQPFPPAQQGMEHEPDSPSHVFERLRARRPRKEPRNSAERRAVCHRKRHVRDGGLAYSHRQQPEREPCRSHQFLQHDGKGIRERPKRDL